MREIKFRAWDSELGFMVDAKHYVLTMNGKVLFDNDGETYDQTNKIELMQFTGIKDKNGKDMYEGDIVEIDSQKFKIYWHDGHAGYWIEGIDQPLNGTWNMYYVSANGEVIGNIYENPELSDAVYTTNESGGKDE